MHFGSHRKTSARDRAQSASRVQAPMKKWLICEAIRVEFRPLQTVRSAHAHRFSLKGRGVGCGTSTLNILAVGSVEPLDA